MEKSEYKVRQMTVTSDDMKKEITIDQGGESTPFTIKALVKPDRTTISSNMAISQRGMPAESFSNVDLNEIRKIETVRIGVIDSPDSWEGVDNCIEDIMIDKLYDEIESFSKEFQENLKKNRYNPGSTKS